MLTIIICCPLFKRAFSAPDPGLTELIKIPLSLPPINEISILRLSPSSVVCCTGWLIVLIRSGKVTDGRKGLQQQKHS